MEPNMSNEIRAAFFYPATKKRQAVMELCVITNGRRTKTDECWVVDKSHARSKAAEFDFTPWNF
jgi:hypothetical protein